MAKQQLKAEPPVLDPKVAKAIAAAIEMRGKPPVQTALGKWAPKK